MGQSGLPTGQFPIRYRLSEGKHYRMAGLNLLAAIVIHWNTVHLSKAARQRKHAGLTVEPEILAYVSPLGWAYILLTGEYRVAKAQISTLAYDSVLYRNRPQLPAVLALYLAEQPFQMLQGPPTRLRPPEPACDALVHLLNPLGPPGDLRHLISPNNQRITSTLLACLKFYPLLIYNCCARDHS